MAQQRLFIEYRQLCSLQLDPQNPRLRSKKQIRQIARSIETFGFIVPVLVDSRGELIAGHGCVLGDFKRGRNERGYHEKRQAKI